MKLMPPPLNCMRDTVKAAELVEYHHHEAW
jgi:hypothetical protein